MTTRSPIPQSHSWRFFRAGGFDQVRLDRGADLTQLDQLDQKLWVALACPTRMLEIDTRMLELMDTDMDGRIRPPELLAAIRWAAGLLKDADALVKPAASLPLDVIQDATPQGSVILASARRVLRGLGKAESNSISVEDAANTALAFAQTLLNGDGVIPPEAAEDPAARKVIEEVIAALGPDADRSGKPGVSQAKVDQFMAESQAYADWRSKASAQEALILPLGELTGEAAAAWRAVRRKVEDFFARCRLAAFDGRAVAALNREEKVYFEIAAGDLGGRPEEVSNLPLARIQAAGTLPLKRDINPAWVDAIVKFDAAVVRPMFGERANLTEAEWLSIESRLSPHEAWMAGKAGGAVEKLGLVRIREILSSNAKEAIAALIAKDKALEGEFNAIADLEKLIRYYRGLHQLCTNFVNFRGFYGSGTEGAIFQVGTLYLDQRACRLCLPVEDAARHAALAGMAGVYLAYCDCVRKGSGEKMQIVAAFTNGDSDHLMVGRNGVFYDRRGRDWDATITKIVENPISLRQAFWMPYKKLVRLIEEQVARRAAASEAASSAKMQTTATAVSTADKAAPKPPEGKKMDVGTVAALGVAFGALGVFLTAVWGNLIKVAGLGPLAIVGAVVGLILLISGPSLLIAWLKLRKRNLGPILDANGWAVNARARINVPFGASLTTVAELPPGAQRELTDPYAEKPSPWPKIVALAVVLWILYMVLDRQGCIHDWTGGAFGNARATAAQPAAAAPE